MCRIACRRGSLLSSPALVYLEEAFDVVLAEPHGPANPDEGNLAAVAAGDRPRELLDQQEIKTFLKLRQPPPRHVQFIATGRRQTQRKPLHGIWLYP